MLGIPLIYQLYVMSQIFGVQNDQEEVSEGNGFTEVLSEEFIQLEFLPYVMIFFVIVFFGWFWSMAIGLQQKVPEEIEMKVNKFKVFFFIPLSYIIFLVISMSGVFSAMSMDIYANIGWIAAIILPLHLLSIFCIFYCIYFVAKTIKTAELKKEVGFGDFAGEFFLLWFYFIGIWFIQPKVNRLYKE